MGTRPVHLAFVASGTDGKSAHDAHAVTLGDGRRRHRAHRRQERPFPQSSADDPPNLGLGQLRGHGVATLAASPTAERDKIVTAGWTLLQAALDFLRRHEG
jgi:hypothetical protein